MARKILLVLAALTLVVAGGALYLSLSSSGASNANGPTTTVLVATGDLPPGILGSDLTSAQVAAVQVPASAVPERALKALTTVSALKTTVPIFKGQTLIERQFSATGATGGLPIPPSMVAVSASVADPSRVAGFVQPGSMVTVFVGGDSNSAKVLLSSAQVIAIGSATQVGSGIANKLVPSTIVTFALTAEDAAKLAVYSADDASHGSIYLGLLPSPDIKTS